MFPFDSLLHIAGLVAALVIGISLGLLGSGGSAITIPVLVYLLGFTPTQAISNSLFVVGVTALTGGFIQWRKGQVRWAPLVWFGIPSVIMVLITRRLVMPRIPHEVFTIGERVYTRETVLMMMFAVMLLFIAYRMVYRQHLHSHRNKVAAPLLSIMVGMVVGLLTGLVGIGGGFLIVPVLVLYFGLNIKEAIGTSLWLIAMNALFGFAVDVPQQDVPWLFLVNYTLLAVAGLFAGVWLARHFSHRRLQIAFGVFILLLGVFIIVQQVWVPV